MFSRRFAILLCLITAIIGIYGVFSPAHTKNTADTVAEFTPQNPNISRLSLSFQKNQNHNVTLHDFTGRYVLLNLWATWCSPCVREMPALDKLASTFDSEKLTVVALNENSKGFEKTTQFYEKHQLYHLEIYTDPTGQIPSAVKAKGLPTTLLINPRGEEVGRWEGSVLWDDPKTRDFITLLINPPKQ